MWRKIALILGLLLFACVVANLVNREAVPHQLTLLLLGCIIAIGIARSIVSPRSSPVILEQSAEVGFQKRQYALGIAFSILLTLLLIFVVSFQSLLAWLFIPIIAMPFALLVGRYVRSG